MTSEVWNYEIRLLSENEIDSIASILQNVGLAGYILRKVGDKND